MNIFTSLAFKVANYYGYHESTVFILVLVMAGLAFLIWLLSPTTSGQLDRPRLQDISELIEPYALNTMGEREFTRRMLDFEQQTGGDYQTALKILAVAPTPEIRQIAYCWLAHKGHGSMTLSKLWSELERCRVTQPVGD